MTNKPQYIVVSEIKKGYSDSKKYKAVYKDEVVFIKRTKECNLNRKIIEKDVLIQLFQKGVRVNQLVDLFVDGTEIISIYSWIDGIVMFDYLKSKSAAEQYKLGELLGRQLSVIHSLKPNLKGEYPSRTKFDNQLKEYLSSKLRYHNDAGWLKFIEQNIDFLGNRESVFLHNDFQIENIMVAKDVPVVIDFERFQIGDPYYDLKRVIVDAYISQEYSAGVIDGYFMGVIPEDFWRVSAFYIAIGTLAAMVWFERETEEYKNVLIKAKCIDEWYKNFNDIKPSWYKEMHRMYYEDSGDNCIKE